jgi:hypothetical protein
VLVEVLLDPHEPPPYPVDQVFGGGGRSEPPLELVVVVVVGEVGGLDPVLLALVVVVEEVGGTELEDPLPGFKPNCVLHWNRQVVSSWSMIP